MTPRRVGPAPTTTPQTPHVQLDQFAPVEVQQVLWDRMRALPLVAAGRSGISDPRSLAVHLHPDAAHGPIEAFLVGTEFAHLHGDGSGSLHLALPAAQALAAIDAGWAEEHPVVTAGYRPHGLVMVYGPRDDDELETVWGLVRDSYHYARATTSVLPQPDGVLG